MKSKNVLCGLSIALVLHFGVLAGSAQTNIYLYSGSETNITLPPGTYIITAYGAPGGGNDSFPVDGGFGTEMSAEFSFSTPTTLTLLVGGCGDTYGDSASAGGGGGGGSFVVQGSTPLVIAGGGGGGPDAGGGNVSTNGGNGVSSPTHFNRGGGGGTGGGGGGGAPTVGGAEGTGGGGGGGGFLGNGGDGTNGDVFAEGGGGGSSFETGGGGGYGGNGFVPGSFGGYDGGGGGYGGGGGGGGTSGGGGGGGGYSGGGGGYGGGGGGGGGSIIDSSAITNLLEVSSISSPDDPGNLGNPGNGEIIIITVPTPPLAITTNAAFGFINGLFGFNVTGPSGSNAVIQASTDLQTWIPLQTNLLGSGLLYFSDAQSATNTRRFYRAQLSP